jgi:hypothetical protein
MSHQYLPWNADDILILEDLYQRGYSKEQMASCLKRTPRAVEHAIRHMINQHMFHYGKEATLKKFSMTESSLEETVAPSIYQPVPYRSRWDSYCPMMTLFTGFVILGLLNMYGSMNVQP